MTNLEAQLNEVIHTVWKTMLDQEISSIELAEFAPKKVNDGVLACIQITGKWSGAITIECSLKLAREMAEEMFGMEPGEALEEEIQDAIGELVNVVGGNLKAFLDGRAELSLPAVTWGENYRVVMPGSHETLRMGFNCNGEGIRVGLLTRTT